ncbi:MAG: radical SAM protein [Candidatus Micrarchaeota archaeon]
MEKPKTDIILITPSVMPDFPGADFEVLADYKCVPIGTLALGSYLKEKGYNVKLFDCRVYPKKEGFLRLCRECKDARLIAFSVMTPDLKHAYLWTKKLRKRFPQKKIVWGGMHPTLFPEQTLKDPNIDFVIAGEGELAMASLLGFLQSKKSLKKTPGLLYKKKSGIVNGGLSAPVEEKDMAKPDYSLLDLEKYLVRPLYDEKTKKERKAIVLDISSSRGCPYACSFCTNTMFAFKRWRPLSAEKVNAAINELVSKHNIDHIWFVDDFFFGNLERVDAIVDNLKAKKFKLTWEADIRADNLVRPNFLTDQHLQRYVKSGLTSLRIGIESGSDRVLKILNKGITVDMSIKAVHRCKKFQIIPICFFMIGIPGETEKDMVQTLQLMDQLAGIYPESVLLGPGLFRPYPGTPLYQECKKSGFHEPQSLFEWAKSSLDSSTFISEKSLPWLKNPGRVIRLQNMASLYFSYTRQKHAPHYPFLRKLLGEWLKQRFKHNFFSLDLEIFFLVSFKKFLNQNAKVKWLLHKVIIRN